MIICSYDDGDNVLIPVNGAVKISFSVAIPRTKLEQKIESVELLVPKQREALKITHKRVSFATNGHFQIRLNCTGGSGEHRYEPWARLLRGRGCCITLSGCHDAKRHDGTNWTPPGATQTLSPKTPLQISALRKLNRVAVEILLTNDKEFYSKNVLFNAIKRRGASSPKTQKVKRRFLATQR
jgi:hypothetical protein